LITLMVTLGAVNVDVLQVRAMNPFPGCS
jgi:hypothetical protein